MWNNHGLSTERGQTPLQLWHRGIVSHIGINNTAIYVTECSHKKDPFAVLFSESKKHNPHDHKQESKIATQEQNAILTQLKTK